MNVKILFEDILNDRRLGIVIDRWNEMYEFEFRPLSHGKFLRIDLQCPEDSDVVTLSDIVKFYIDQIENKMSYEPDHDWASFKHDLKILEGAIIYEGEGITLVAKKCKSCGNHLRYGEYVDGYNYCEDCEGVLE